MRVTIRKFITHHLTASLSSRTCAILGSRKSKVTSGGAYEQKGYTGCNDDVKGSSGADEKARVRGEERERRVTRRVELRVSYDAARAEVRRWSVQDRPGG